MDQPASSFLFSLATKISYGLLAGLVGLSAFLGRQWLKSEKAAQARRDTEMRTAISQLARSISDLNRTLTGLDKAQALHAQALETVIRDMEGLKHRVDHLENVEV